ncbi:MAG: translational GTPase TypA [Bacillota bacterium]|nr:translational GTPase TypA [Bacillota bacterium]
MDVRKDIRNIAIIAHVDHGKTTLVDQMLWQSGIFRANEQVQERVMDSNDLERERGITILAKNTAVVYKGVKINIVDTPGHADFGGEVERILTMVNGVLLLVDAFEGCMPQTRFVMKKALSLGKQPIVVINKVDRPGARPFEVIDEVLDLIIELGAEAHQLDYPVVYASAREGWATLERGGTAENLEALFETILAHVPAPTGEMDKPLQILFPTIDYDDYIGRIGIGRVERGVARYGQQCVLCKNDGTLVNVKITRLYQFHGLKRIEVEEARLGDIVAVAGLGSLNIGETLCDTECVEPLKFVNIDEPTISMLFIVNNSPFAGRDGKYVTSRNLRERLFKEVETNVSMRVEETDSPDSFKVSGRGELHLSILIETMRRQDYEFQVSRPKVIYKEEKGTLLEPIEMLVIYVPEEYLGAVMEKLGQRKAELLNMAPDNQGGIRLEFKIPARGLIGYRTEFMTDTKGNGIMNHVFSGHEPYKGDIAERSRGSMVAFETGEATTYGLFNAQERGKLFVAPGTKVYEGMIVGENAKADDLVVNVCKKKHVTNIRAAGADEALKLTTPVVFSLEQALEFIADDELVEVTPKNIRLRKMTLSKEMRIKNLKKEKEH